MVAVLDRSRIPRCSRAAGRWSGCRRRLLQRLTAGIGDGPPLARGGLCVAPALTVGEPVAGRPLFPHGLPARPALWALFRAPRGRRRGGVPFPPAPPLLVRVVDGL